MNSQIHASNPTDDKESLREDQTRADEESDDVSDSSDDEHNLDLNAVRHQPHPISTANSIGAEPIQDYATELATSRVGRHSRASSIFSTRTHLTNLTLDDARSIEIVAGGQSFRISRDGSRVTNVTAPPPYPGPPLEVDVEDESDLDNYVDLSDRSDASDAREAEEQTPKLLPQRPPPIDDIDEELALTNSTKLDLSSSVFEIPAKIKRAFGVHSLVPSPSVPGFSVTPPTSEVPIPPPPRRTQSDTSNYSWFRPWSRASIENLSSASKNASNDNLKLKEGQRPSTSHMSESSDVLNGMGSGFESHKRGYSHRSLPEQLDLASSASTIAELEEDDYEDEDDERAAEISSHYSQVMRNLDREHRKKLHERDKELSQLRQLLHEKDIVYRQQLRDKDISVEGFRAQSVMKDGLVESLKQQLIQVEEGLRSQSDLKDSLIETLKQQLAQVEEGLETKLEQARHSVEDMWEKRWKAHEKLLLERLRQANIETRGQDTYSLRTVDFHQAKAQVPALRTNV